MKILDDFLNREISTAIIAETLWKKLPGIIQESEICEGLPDICFDEIMYFLSFANDLSINNTFKDQPNVNAALRDMFLHHLRDFAMRHNCRALPKGSWQENSNIYIIATPLKLIGDPIQNLSDRFDLYLASMKRDNSISFAPVGLLSAFCGFMDIAFSMSATSLFMGILEANQHLFVQLKAKHDIVISK